MYTLCMKSYLTIRLMQLDNSCTVLQPSCTWEMANLQGYNSANVEHYKKAKVVCVPCRVP